MIDEVYKGIRPAGYPCPDHLENLLFGNYKRSRRNRSNLDRKYGDVARFVRVRLLFCTSRKQVFGLGKIKEDQVIDYAKRRSISTDKAMKWLGPNIAD
jgi:5-methyltetrahydrofolate--homocysteine methyltransferase